MEAQCIPNNQASTRASMAPFNSRTLNARSEYSGTEAQFAPTEQPTS